MLKTITLQNYRSFGIEQTIPLEPLTVLVGPNNAGKSSLMTLGQFLQRVGMRSRRDGKQITSLWSEPFLIHQPPQGTGLVTIGWTTDSREGKYSTSWRPRPPHDVQQVHEQLSVDGRSAWQDLPNEGMRFADSEMTRSDPRPFSGLREIYARSSVQNATVFREVIRPLLDSGFAALSKEVLRRDSTMSVDTALGSDGANLAGVVGLWRNADPTRTEQLEEFVRGCVPEVRNIFVKPVTDAQGAQMFRLWVRQRDGQEFDATALSDGLLWFIGLAAHAIALEPGAVLFVEEPEQTLHPRRLANLLDLFRRIVSERRCQVVLATHSPILLNEFRDEPEAILAFQRGPEGTLVRSVRDIPELMQALTEQSALPGSLLADGFFPEKP